MKQKTCLLLIFICTLTCVVPTPSFAALSGGYFLLSEANRMLNNMKSSVYQHETFVDEARGIYMFDCSGFLTYALRRVLPQALAAVAYIRSSSNRPRAQDYHNHFTDLGPGLNPGGWCRITSPIELLPGDVIAWLKSPDSDSNNTGHVMIVKSASNKSPARLDEVLIAIIDSTGHPHANDSRARGTPGLGAGTIGLIMNSTGNAVAFTWRGGESTKEEMTEISFGRIGDKMEHSTARHATTSETIGMTTIIDQVVVATAAIALTITALIVRTRLGKEKSYVNASTNRAR